MRTYLRSDPFGLGSEVLPAAEVARDRALGSEVANHIMDFVMERLADYYGAFPQGGTAMQVRGVAATALYGNLWAVGRQAGAWVARKHTVCGCESKCMHVLCNFEVWLHHAGRH